MQSISKKAVGVAGALACCIVFLASPGLSQDYAALKGLDSIRAVFDCREGDPGALLAHLNLTYQTYMDQSVRKKDQSPDFAVVFMGQSVVFLSRDREGFSPAEKEILKKMDKLLVKMAEAGITLEVCKVAAGGHNVDIDSIIPQIEPVPNGWISSIGYQAKGYSLVPIY